MSIVNLKNELYDTAMRNRNEIPPMVKAEMQAAARQGELSITIDSSRLHQEQIDLLKAEGFVVNSETSPVYHPDMTMEHDQTTISWTKEVQ